MKIVGVDYKICCQYCYSVEYAFVENSPCILDDNNADVHKCENFLPWSVRQQIKSKRKRYEKKLRKLTKQYY